MGLFSSLNKTKKFDFTADKDFPYISLKDLLQANDGDLEHIYVIRALYINSRSKYGEQPLIAIDDAYVNIPKHMLETVKGILANDEMIDAINKGLAGFKIRPYEDKSGIDRLSIDWIDLKA